MRYFQSDTVAFTDAAGRTANLKEILPMIGRASASTEVECRPDTALDEIATRDEAYGEGAEASSYRIFEENAVEIIEARVDMSRIKKLRIPL